MGSRRDTSHLNRKAFTVIEFLLGMLIFSIVAASLYSLFSTGLLINRKAAKLGDSVHELRWLFDRLQRDLENARRYDFSGSYPEQLSFHGESDALTCLRAGPEGLYWVRYALEEPDYGKITRTTVGGKYPTGGFTMESISEEKTFQLVHQTLPFTELLEDPHRLPEWETMVLADGVKRDGLKFGYGVITTVEGRQTVSWAESWDNPGLPLLVRIELTVVDGEKEGRDVQVVRDIQIPVSR